MPVNQPPIKSDPTESAWDLEITQAVNRLENQVTAIDIPVVTAASIGAVSRTEFNGRVPVRLLSGTDRTTRTTGGGHLLEITHNFGHTNYAFLYNIVHGSTVDIVETGRVLVIEKTNSIVRVTPNETLIDNGGTVSIRNSLTPSTEEVLIDWAIISYE